MYKEAIKVMPAPLSQDLRERVTRAYERKEGSFQALGVRFDIGEATVNRWVTQKRKSGGLEPKPRGGSKPKLSAAQRETLHAWVLEECDATLAMLVERAHKEFGVQVSISSMSRTLIKLGLTLKKSRSSSTRGTPSA